MSDAETAVRLNLAERVDELEKLRPPYNVSALNAEATLFALGIHEDTGSLTYPTATQRDELKAERDMLLIADFVIPEQAPYQALRARAEAAAIYPDVW